MQELQQASLRRNRALLLTVTISFLLLLGSSGLMLRVLRQGDAADRRVEHTLDVKHAISELTTELSDAEAAQRGYLLTLDPSFLSYSSGVRATLDRDLVALRNLVADNSMQSARVEELAPMIEKRIGAIETTLILEQQGRHAEAVKVVSELGAPLMRDIRARLGEIDRAESQLLIERQRHVAEARQRFMVSVAAMLVACAVLAIIALVSVRRYIAQIERSRSQLAGYNAELEARVHERTGELAKSVEVANRERSRAESLLTDVNHRVGNNLALVSSFLTMQQRTVRNPEAARALTGARARVQAIASAHRKLRLGADFASVKANEVLGAVLEDISAGLPPGDLIRINHQLQPLDINARDAVSLGVLTSELVMNAVKHAFAPGEHGEIQVVFGSESGSVPFLEVSDDGVGWHDEQLQKNGHDIGLGAKIIEMVARQFGGRPQRSTARENNGRRPGTRVRVELGRLQLLQPS